jgi:hypothetical protein
MSLLALATLTWVVSPPPAYQAQPPDRPRTILERVVLRPDPNNGYEDYLRAVDLVDRPLQLLLTWTPSSHDHLRRQSERAMPGDPDGALTQELMSALAFYEARQDKTLLEIRREAVARYGRLLDLVRLGNRKRVYDPRQGYDQETLFPEYSATRYLSRLFVASAHVRLAAGNTRGAADDLVAGLAFSHWIQVGPLISALVGMANQAIVAAEMEWMLARLSESDLERLESTADAILSGDPPMKRALDHERAGSIASLRKIIDGGSVSGILSADDDDAARADQLIEGLDPAQRQSMFQRVSQRVQRANLELGRRFTLPEARWYDRGFPQPGQSQGRSVQSLADLEDVLSGIFGTEGTAPVFQALGRQRTQLRLLVLHCRIERFRLHHRRLPKSLDEAGALHDPYADAPFVYEVREREDYRLFSRGTLNSGIIELRNRSLATPGSQQQERTPPPSTD